MYLQVGTVLESAHEQKSQSFAPKTKLPSKTNTHYAAITITDGKLVKHNVLPG